VQVLEVLDDTWTFIKSLLCLPSESRTSLVLIISQSTGLDARIVLGHGPMGPFHIMGGDYQVQQLIGHFIAHDYTYNLSLHAHNLCVQLKLGARQSDEALSLSLSSAIARFWLASGSSDNLCILSSSNLRSKFGCSLMFVSMQGAAKGSRAVAEHRMMSYW
jgi:hypothetical protein